MTLANGISLARLALAPVISWCLLHSAFRTGFCLLVIGGFSDLLDGFVARLFHNQTTLGQYLDPIADKVLLTITFVTLGVLGVTPWWLIALVLTRDMSLLIGAGILMHQVNARRLRPRLLSKINTFVQVFYVGALMFDLAYVRLDFLPFLMYTAALTTILSGLDYAHMAWNLGRVHGPKR